MHILNGFVVDIVADDSDEELVVNGP